jgi:hypothetical protein
VCYKWLLNLGFLIIFLERNGYKVFLNDIVSTAGYESISVTVARIGEVGGAMHLKVLC